MTLSFFCEMRWRAPPDSSAVPEQVPLSQTFPDLFRFPVGPLRTPGSQAHRFVLKVSAQFRHVMGGASFHDVVFVKGTV